MTEMYGLTSKKIFLCNDDLRIVLLRKLKHLSGVRSWNGMAAFVQRHQLRLLLLSTVVVFSYLIGSGKLSLNSNKPTRPRPKQAGPFLGYRDCNPINQIVFLKTHKTASSSLQNLLLRYGLKNSLLFALPQNGNHMGGLRPFKRFMVEGTPWHRPDTKYDIFCIHSKWDYEEVRSIMAGDPAFISIVRDPVEQFRSMWDYGDFGSAYGMTLEEYALSERKAQMQTRFGSLGRNQMLWDFGMKARDLANKTAIEEKIAEIDRTFDLVMLSERFDESMILLRDLLCWEYRDVTNLKLNARIESKKSTVSDKARTALKEWLWGDYLLYDHFKKRFEKEVEQYGVNRLAQELSILKNANEHLMDMCIEGQANAKQLPRKYKLMGPQTLGYKVKDENEEFCQYYAMREISFIDLLRNIQLEGAKKNYEARGEKWDFDNRLYADFPVSANGRPDVEALKSMFKHKSKQGASGER